MLVAARLYSPVALVNVVQWAADSGADILWIMPRDKINDDRLGRSLDAFFDQRHSILASLALQVAREFKLSLTEVHYDPTHILLHGAYESSEARGDWTTAAGQVHSDDQCPGRSSGRCSTNTSKAYGLLRATRC